MPGRGGQASQEGSHTVGAVSPGPQHSPEVECALEAGDLIEPCHGLYCALVPTWSPVQASSQPGPPAMPGRFMNKQVLREPRASADSQGFGTSLNHSGIVVFGGGTRLTVIGKWPFYFSLSLLSVQGLGGK